MALGHFNEVENTENTEDRKAEAEKKIDDFNAQIDDTVKKHGEMLKNRRDLSPDEKNELQTEITENAKKAKEDFRSEVEKEYPELKEGDGKDGIKEEQDEIGDEL